MKLQPGVGYTFSKSWSGTSLVIEDQLTAPNRPPFTVVVYKSAGVFKAKVTAGNVNNVIPYINGTLMTDPTYTPLDVPTSPGVYVVAIKCKADPAPATFPRTDSEIIIDTYPLTDTDTEGYIVLANLSVTSTSGVTAVAVYQSVSGSLWAERHKYTEPDSASYFFYRV